MQGLVWQEAGAFEAMVFCLGIPAVLNCVNSRPNPRATSSVYGSLSGPFSRCPFISNASTLDAFMAWELLRSSQAWFPPLHEDGARLSQSPWATTPGT